MRVDDAVLSLCCVSSNRRGSVQSPAGRDGHLSCQAWIPLGREVTTAMGATDSLLTCPTSLAFFSPHIFSRTTATDRVQVVEDGSIIKTSSSGRFDYLLNDGSSSVRGDGFLHIYAHCA